MEKWFSRVYLPQNILHYVSDMFSKDTVGIIYIPVGWMFVCFTSTWEMCKDESMYASVLGYTL